MSLYKNIIREPVRVLVDIYYFQLTAYKKPVSFIFNYILPYQSLRIKIDAFLTKIYQTKFMKLEKDNSKKKHLEKMYEDGVINIDNFYNFENTELLIELIDNHNQKELDKIINKIKQEVMDKLIYYLSFLRGENLDVDSIYCSLQCNDKIDKNDEFHTDVFSHSPKAFIYIHDVLIDGRPFLYLISSHKDYEARKDLEKITNKCIYNGSSKFGEKSSRVKEHKNYQKKYFEKYQKFIGTVKAGSIVFVDTCGFHAKGEGTKPRYTFQVGIERKGLINKVTSIFKLKKFIKFN